MCSCDDGCYRECCQQNHERHVTGKVFPYPVTHVPHRSAYSTYTALTGVDGQIPLLPARYLSCDNELSPSHLGRGSEYSDTLTIQV